jgi:type I restriction enzyme S subunit
MTTTPKYVMRDSGHEWLGEIPAHWLSIPFRHVFRESSEVNGLKPVGEMLSISGYRGVEFKEYSSDTMKRDDDQLETYRVVRVGRLAVNTMWLNYAGLGVSKVEGHMSPAYRSYDFKLDVNRDYIHHLLRSQPYVQGYTARLQGVRPNSLQMSRESLMTMPVLIPPRADQEAIVEFLDRELAQIDALLSVQLRLKDLIEERLESRILKTVCGNTVETSNWLGALPIGWGKVPLREVATIQAGGTPTSDNETYWLDGDDAAGIPWLNIGDFDTNADITSTKQRVTSLGAASKNLPVGPPGTIVFAMYASVGSVSRIGMRASWSQAILGIQTKKNYSDRYLYWVLRAFKNQLPFYFRSNTQNNINASQVRSFMLPYPPLDEQLSIAMRLDQKSKEDQFLLQKAQSLIDALTERRAAIIAETVTGKVHIKETL